MLGCGVQWAAGGHVHMTSRDGGIDSLKPDSAPKCSISSVSLPLSPYFSSLSPSLSLSRCGTGRRCHGEIHFKGKVMGCGEERGQTLGFQPSLTPGQDLLPPVVAGPPPRLVPGPLLPRSPVAVLLHAAAAENPRDPHCLALRRAFLLQPDELA